MAMAFTDEGASTAGTWDSPAVSDHRFQAAQVSLVNYIMTRAFTQLAQEAYRQTRGESTRRWVNIFSYHYPRKGSDIKAGAVPSEELVNMWWANFPTVSLMVGPKDNPGEFERLGLIPTEDVIKTSIEYPGSPFRCFAFNGGKQVGNVIQVRWDKCVGKAYIKHCENHGKRPDIREGERVLGAHTG